MPAIAPFHLAFPVDDLQKARTFYGGLMGCAEGRSSSEWIDFDFFGHQLVAHLAPRVARAHHNPVDGHAVPVPHFGVVLPWDEFHALAERLKAAGMRFVIEPYLRFEGAGGRAGHPVLPRPGRQRPRVQGVQGHVATVREVSFPA